ncbi:MAG: choice-of-anchor N protein [Pseudomonadota bacterium]
MQAIKLLAAFLIAVTCVSASASPILQLGITNGSYDADSADVVTTQNSFTLNAYGKTKGGNAATTNTTYFLSIAVLAHEGLTSADFGSFMLGNNTFTLKDMVFGNPPFESSLGHEGGDLAPHGVYDTWFLQYGFQFSGANLTSDVNVEKNPAFDPLANPGKDYFFKSFDVNTKGLFNGYNLHFDLFNTQVNKKGDVTIGSNAPFSHDASTAYEYVVEANLPSSVPEPSTFVIFALALAGIVASRKLVWPPAHKVKD